MTKYAAYGTTLEMGAGNVQSETATIVGTIGPAGAGNATVTITAANMTGSPLALSVPVANDDTAAIVAGKIRDFLISDATAATVRELFDISGATIYVVLARKIPMANDAALNIAYTNGTCSGLTPDATSDATTAGETLAAVAQISNISGPGLSIDTEDVTTHDSPGAWEEHVATILRSGELSLDIVYDPNDGTHDASTGLISRLESRAQTGFEVTFATSYTWAFAAYVTGFEPAAPVDGALTAYVTLKLTGAPIIV
jgi:predicted secreted protein